MNTDDRKEIWGCQEQDPKEIIDTFVDEFYADEELLRCDGFDDAVLGVAHLHNGHPVLVYDTEVILQTLVSRDGMDYESASEFFEFNVAGAYVGEATPIFVRRIPGVWDRPLWKILWELDQVACVEPGELGPGVNVASDKLLQWAREGHYSG